MQGQSALFVTGTDTNVGKTIVGCGLLAAAKKYGLSTLAMKPMASGSMMTPKGLRNADATALMQTMTVSMDYASVNPLAFAPATAPHIAAAQIQQTISMAHLIKACQKILKKKANFTLIEGVGGWRVPLSLTASPLLLSDLVKALCIPVVLVVGVKLGCLNHAYLSLEAFEKDDISLIGWVANQIDANMLYFEETLQTLHTFMPKNFIGCVPFLSSPTPEKVAPYLSWSLLESYIFSAQKSDKNLVT